MTDAPDRIWANITVRGDGKPLAGEWNHCDVGSDDDTPYIRDDIHAALEAENARLREAILNRLNITVLLAHMLDDDAVSAEYAERVRSALDEMMRAIDETAQKGTDHD